MHWQDLLRRASTPVHSSRWFVLVGVTAALASACATTPEPTERPQATTPSSTATTRVVAPPASTVPSFIGRVSTIDPATAGRMSFSWRAGCPVPIQELRLLTLTHWGFDDRAHRGELIIAAQYADEILLVFRRLYETRFPIQSIRLIDEFGGDDDRSMAANNTSAFNCRAATGTTRWSEHAYGRAVDVNPIQNPYVTPAGDTFPPAGAPYAARETPAQGLITPDGPVVAAFRDIGWLWGGDWTSARDYQHFSSSGQ